MPSCGHGARRCPSSLWRSLPPLVGNVRDFSNEGPYSGEFLESYRKDMLAIPRVPMADQVPRDLRPDRTLAPYVSVGWLLDGVGAGRIPPPEGIGPKDLAAEEAPVVLHEYPSHRPADCETVTGPVTATLERGSSIRTRGPAQLWVSYTDSSGAVGLAVFRGRNVPVVAYAGALNVSVASTAPVKTLELCDPEGGPVTVPSGP